MKTHFNTTMLAVLLILAAAVESRAFDTAFTYQGRLDQNGRPANGFFDLRFELHSAPAGENPSAPSVELSQVGVTNGLFTAALDFDVVELVASFTGFDGQELWLNVAVRSAGGGTFASLSPRQSLAPVPSALFALKALTIPGVSSNALHSANGDVRDALFVDGAGNVGIGTTNPASRLHVVSEAAAEFPPRLRSFGAGGFNAGWDFYHGRTGKGYLGVPDAGAVFAPGEMLLFSAPGSPVTLWSGGTRALTASVGGTLGIGTFTPLAKLEVHGDVRLGEAGQFQATSGDENLRIIRGVFNPDGTIISGRGFTVVRENNEFVDYTIRFKAPFAGTPTVTSDAGTDNDSIIAGLVIVEPSTTGFVLRPKPRVFHHQLNRPIHFIAVGPW